MKTLSMILALLLVVLATPTFADQIQGQCQGQLQAQGQLQGQKSRTTVIDNENDPHWYENTVPSANIDTEAGQEGMSVSLGGLASNDDTIQTKNQNVIEMAKSVQAMGIISEKEMGEDISEAYNNIKRAAKPKRLLGIFKCKGSSNPIMKLLEI